MMRIGIDVRYLSHGLVGGVQMYVAQFTAALLKIATEHEIILYADTKRPFEIDSPPRNVTLRLLPWKTPLSTVYHDLFLARTMEQDNIDIAHFTGNYGFGPRGTATVITLQDEINLLPLREIIRGHRRDVRTITMMTYLHILTSTAIRQADLVITVSEYSRRQILRYGRLDPQHIVAVHHACPSDISRISEEAVCADVRSRLGIMRPFILAEAFKNPAVIVRAWKKLAPELRDQHEIVFFSRSPDVLPIVHEAINAGCAKLFIRPDRRDLSALYSMAAAFVFPSWIEGFGIPLVEAMVCGAPIIASDRGSIPEVVGNAGMIIDAEDDAALANHLVDVLGNPVIAANLQARGFARATQFSWDNNAYQVLDLYGRLARDVKSIGSAERISGS